MELHNILKAHKNSKNESYRKSSLIPKELFSIDPRIKKNALFESHASSLLKDKIYTKLTGNFLPTCVEQEQKRPIMPHGDKIPSLDKFTL